ncbi:hypothetical protein [Hyphomonas oceanitis]|uniref:Uncharacterized protein n=1 Tax=Hyphomonas oceanitis SCH89 TaxID=1280953 RepID=A0A059G1K0_9PROT|nr:hypothetical protein [Hyphomonas oceanitis]KDA00742.1 hypothetical protein HOC_19091 [Hyphomonas oceanitis SCH89]|tara:strand:+ start:962 stop:1150 length:189 start_codon:yes stop_codon:yes gene_type:complete
MSRWLAYRRVLLAAAPHLPTGALDFSEQQQEMKTEDIQKTRNYPFKIDLGRCSETLVWTTAG